MFNTKVDFPVYYFNRNEYVTAYDAVKDRLPPGELVTSEKIFKYLSEDYRKEDCIGPFGKLPLDILRTLFDALDAKTAFNFALVNKKMCWTIINCNCLNPKLVLASGNTIFNTLILRSNDAGVLRMLHNSALKLKDENMESVFSSLCEYNNVASVKAFLDHKSFRKEEHGKSGFELACKKGKVEVVEFLLKDGRVNPKSFFLLSNVIECVQSKVLKLLFEDPRLTTVGGEYKLVSDAIKVIDNNQFYMERNEITNLKDVNKLKHIIDFLLEKFSETRAYKDIKQTLRRDLINAIRCHNTYKMDIFLGIERVTSIPDLLDEAFLEACYTQKTETIKMFLSHKSFDFSKHNNILEKCASNFNSLVPEVAQLLLDDARIHYDPFNNNLELLKEICCPFREELLITVISHQRVEPYLEKILEKAMELNLESLVDFLNKNLKHKKLKTENS